MTDMEKCIRQLMKEGLYEKAQHERIALYPFGHWGSVIKRLIEEDYGLKVDIIIDNELSKYNPSILSIEKVNNPCEYIWIVTSQNNDIRYHLIDGLKENGVDEKNIIDIWERIWLSKYPDPKYICEIPFFRQMIDNRLLFEPAEEVVYLIKSMKAKNKEISFAEIGVGYGATAIGACYELEKGDIYYAFDYAGTADKLIDGLKGIREITCSLQFICNTDRYWDSYAWNLSKMVYKMRNEGNSGMFDLVYLDGAHNFLIDGLACCLIKELLKSDGYIVFDDINWSYSEFGWPKAYDNNDMYEFITEEQSEDKQVQRVLNMFMENDPMFERIYLQDGVSYRAVYKKGS